MDVEPVAKVIDSMANTMQKYCDELKNLANIIRETEDIYYAGEAVNAVINCITSLRLDLLITRPVKILEKHIKNQKD